MYTQVIYHYPAVGKAPNLIAALAERNKASKAAGLPHAVAQRMYGPEPVIVSATQFQDMGAIEAWQQQSAEPSFQAVVAKINATLSRPQSVELVEPVISAEPGSEAKYVFAASYFPAAGRAADLRQALNQRVRETKLAGAVGMGFNTQIAPEEGATFTVNVLFSSLSGFEEAIHDSAFRTPAGDPSMLARPIRQRLYRILMPFSG